MLEKKKKMRTHFLEITARGWMSSHLIKRLQCDSWIQVRCWQKTKIEMGLHWQKYAQLGLLGGQIWDRIKEDRFLSL